MNSLIQGLYFCGILLLVTGILGVLSGKMLKRARHNAEAWDDYYKGLQRKQELEDELERFGKE